jgi:hypothetical protein
MVFDTLVCEVRETVGPARVLAVMTLLHPLAALVRWTTVRPEPPSYRAAP